MGVIGEWGKTVPKKKNQKNRPKYTHWPKFTESISRVAKLLSAIFLYLAFLIFYLYSGVCITGSSMGQTTITNPCTSLKKSKLETALKEISSGTSGQTCKQAGEGLACLCQRCVSSWFYQNTHTKKCISVTPLRVASLHKKDVFWDPHYFQVVFFSSKPHFLLLSVGSRVFFHSNSSTLQQWLTRDLFC